MIFDDILGIGEELFGAVRQNVGGFGGFVDNFINQQTSVATRNTGVEQNLQQQTQQNQQQQTQQQIAQTGRFLGLSDQQLLIAGGVGLGLILILTR